MFLVCARYNIEQRDINTAIQPQNHDQHFSPITLACDNSIPTSTARLADHVLRLGGATFSLGIMLLVYVSNNIEQSDINTAIQPHNHAQHFSPITLASDNSIPTSTARLAGQVLRLGGATFALSIVPLVCLCSTALLATRATPLTLVFVETLRKVVSYSFAKPARELLFTKVPDDAKYKAKLVLDTVVQRLGDALGAAIFSILGTQLLSSAVALLYIEALGWSIS
jgi:hypothetical protein